MRIGYFLSCEEYSPAELVDQARRAEQAGFESLWISDHFHPWMDVQGEAAHVWTVIGAVTQACSLPISTAVTCPTVRQHPAIVAHAAATSSVLNAGQFILGVGSGEALNEHVVGARWPDTSVRLEMLEEAVEVMRLLWGGGYVDHHGTHYTVENARLFTLPDTPPPVYVSGFGPKAIQLAGRIGDGFVTTSPDTEPIGLFRDSGGGDKPVSAGYKVCWGVDEDAAAEVAHRRWANSSLPGELSQVLPSPAHFEQASQLVTPEMTRSSVVCGHDLEQHVAEFRPFAEAGIDDIHIAQMGGREEPTNTAGFFDFYRDEVLPALRRL